MTVYDIGDKVRLLLTITTSTGGGASGTVTLVVTDPAGASSTIASAGLTSTATGKYRYDKVTTAAGRWLYQFVSTGNSVLSEGGAFAVRPRYASTQ